MKDNIFELGRRIIGHELIKGSSYYFIGNLIGNIFAFFLNLFLARKLTPLDYGIYASLISLFSLAILIPQSFLTTVVQFATGYFSRNEFDKAKYLYRKTLLLVTIVGGIIFVGLICMSPNIQNFLHISNGWLVIFVGVLIVTYFILSVNTAYLQSLLQFGFVSFILALGNAIKLIFGIVFVLMGYKIFGALGAIFFSFFIPFLLSFMRLKFLLVPSAKKVSVSLGDIYKYALPSMIAIMGLSSFISSDVILAKHFFSGYNAGIYAGISLVGKVIFYFTAIVPTVMFPLLVKRSTKGDSVLRTFYLGILLVAIPSVGLTIFYFLFPTFVLRLFLGGNGYVQAGSNLGYMALVLSIYSIITVITNFFLSLKQTKIVFPIVALAVLQIVSIYSFHRSIFQIILDSLIVSSMLLIILSIYFIYHHTVVKTYISNITAPQEV